MRVPGWAQESAILTVQGSERVRVPGWAQESAITKVRV
jgi:hypothetical protein